jgi:hypothetical protein
VFFSSRRKSFSSSGSESGKEIGTLRIIRYIHVGTYGKLNRGSFPRTKQVAKFGGKIQFDTSDLVKFAREGFYAQYWCFSNGMWFWCTDEENVETSKQVHLYAFYMSLYRSVPFTTDVFTLIAFVDLYRLVVRAAYRYRKEYFIKNSIHFYS